MNRYLTILSLYWLVGAVAWMNGYAAGIWLERRRQENRAWPAPILVDLTEVHLYDWQIDGGGECPDCAGRGTVSFPDPFLGGAHLDAACPTCSTVRS